MKRISITTLVACILTIPALAQAPGHEVTQTWRLVNGCWKIFYNYRHWPAGVGNVKRICVDFPAGTGDIAAIGAPPGWAGFICPGAGGCPGGGAPRVCWTTAGAGIPPSPWPVGGFWVKLKRHAKVIPGVQTWKSWTRAAPGAPWALVSSGSTILPSQGGNRISATQTLPGRFGMIPGQHQDGMLASASGPERWQLAYDAGQLQVSAVAEIQGIAIRLHDPNLASFGGSYDVTVTMATATAGHASLSTSFAGNMGSDATVTFSGNWNPGAVAPTAGPVAAWIDIPFTTPFVYDPTAGDLVIQLDVNAVGTSLGGMLDVVAGAAGEIGGALYGYVGSASAATASIMRPDLAPVARLDYEYVQTHQMNPEGAILRLDDLGNLGASPIELLTGFGVPSVLSLDSATLSLLPWDLGISFAPTVGSGSPTGIITPGGQHWNLDLSDPFLFLLNGAQYNNAMVPVQLPVVPAGPALVTAQMIILDPTRPDGYQLSAANELDVRVPQPQPLPGPTGNDASRTYSVGDFGVGMLRIFEQPYATFHVSSNGRVTFGAPDATSNPNLDRFRGGHPSVGLWADLDPGQNGQILVGASNGLLTVDYQGVALAANPFLTVSFQIGFDTFSGDIIISGLAGLPFSGQPMILGASPGAFGPAQDPGQLPALQSNPQPQPGPGDNAMIYLQGPIGPVPGVDVLVLIRNGAGYDIVALP